MSGFAKEILPVNLVDEMRQSYLDYAMSVIVGRALPDARDGLKPVHRRVLFSMNNNGNYYNKSHTKSASVVGDVMGKYHPHGDSAIYDAVVRLAQPFSMRYQLIDGQGNFGSVDGDAAAAMRYTEVRMAKIAHSMLGDIDKETVDFVPNYDSRLQEPTVLPTRIPQLLVNGGTGIAVGMATNIPPHHLGETLDACLHLMAHPEASVADLMHHLPAPDFPTGAMINGTQGIKTAYETGRGRVHIRAKTHIESDERSGKETIVVDELPYQVNKARLIERIGELVKEKRIDGITALRDESDKDGIRMVIELRRGEVAEVILNNLFQITALQTVFGINMVALVAGQPRVLNLKQMLQVFIAHRREIVTRRTIYELRQARERAHLLEGLTVALVNIDAIITLIRTAKLPAQAKQQLLAQSWQAGKVVELLARAGAENSRPDELPPECGLHGDYYQLSEAQAQAILDLRLHRLTGLEQDKIIDEFKEIIVNIESFLKILNDEQRLLEVIASELQEIREQFNDPRRTTIHEQHLNLELEDLIAEEQRVITLSHEGYVKSQPLSDYEAQRRGGKGRSVTAVKEQDFVEQLFVASSHDTLLCFSSFGTVYWLKVYELPQAGRGAKGKPIVNLLPFAPQERLNAVLAVRDYPEDQYLIFATKRGVVKKTSLAHYSRPRSNGIIAINLRDDDELVDVAITKGDQDIMLFSNAGKATRFHESQVRSISRGAAGMRGMKLDADQVIIAMCVLEKEGEILTVTENGYGKRTLSSQYPRKNRATKGVIAIDCSKRNGEAICAMQVNEDEEIMLVTNSGTMIRTAVAEISISGRNTQGVRLIRTNVNEKLIALAKIVSEDEQNNSGGD